MIFELRRHLQFIFDLAVAVYFFWPVIKNAKTWRKIVSLVFLVLCAPLYYAADISIWIRPVFRTIVYFISLWIAGTCSVKKRAYLSILLTTCLTAVQNVFFTPKLIDIYRAVYHFTGIKTLNFVLCIFVQWLLMAITIWAVRKGIAPEKMDDPNIFEIITLLFAIACEFYIKQALPAANEAGGDPRIEITVFSIILNVFVMAFVVAFERYISGKREQEELRLQDALNKAYMRNQENLKRRDEDVRRLHHDMKNHLLAIESLAGAENSGKISEYIQSLNSELHPYDDLVETGNDLLNSILSEKLAHAAANDTEMEIQADCRSISHVNDADLCTIFGNALDNAIEACKKVPDEDDRFISVRTEKLLGQVFIRITNSYSEDIDLKDGLPKTTKKDPRMHGIGLKSIQRTVEKYGGSMRLNAENNKFSMIIMIPEKKPD